MQNKDCVDFDPRCDDEAVDAIAVVILYALSPIDTLFGSFM